VHGNIDPLFQSNVGMVYELGFIGVTLSVLSLVYCLKDFVYVL